MESPKHPLSDWIESRGLKQAQAAQKLGVSEPYLSQVLSWKRNLSMKRAAGWAKVTGLPLTAFMVSEAAE